MATELTELTDTYFGTMTKEVKLDHHGRILNLLKSATEEGVQEITIISGESVHFKSKGVLSVNLSLKPWTDDTFNYFLEHISRQNLENTRSSRKGENDSIEINTRFFELMLKENVSSKYSKDFAINLQGKTLRIHAVSVYSGGSQDSAFGGHYKYCFTIRVVPLEIPTYDSLNLPDIFKKATTLNGGLILISGHTGSGKSQPITTEIPTPKGIVPMGDLKVGDYVFDRKGKPTKVLCVFPQGELDVYEVALDDGRKVLCNNEHIWSILVDDVFENKTTQELMEMLELPRPEFKEIMIPNNFAVEYPEQELDVHPFTYGKDLEESGEDFIKPEYLTSAINQRFDLVKGVFSSNYLCVEQSVQTFFTEEKVAKDFKLLLHSLGYVVSEVYQDSEESYVVEVYPDQVGFEKLFDNPNEVVGYEDFYSTPLSDTTDLYDLDRVAISKIENLNYREEQVCIKVDNPEHLYLTNDYVVTHNTTTIASLVKEINTNPAMKRSILTVEDPIEFVHESAQALILQRAIGINTGSYSEATKDALRENVDTVVIGELREMEEMDNAIRLAEMGKLVFATVHSNSPADTVDRIVNEFGGDLQESIRSRLSETVVGILHQNLEVIYSHDKGEDIQVPVASGFLIQNSSQKSKIRNQFTRENISNIIKTESWAKSHSSAYQELVTKGVVLDTEENKSKLVPS